jgi:lipopolysaccharide export system protein LptA
MDEAKGDLEAGGKVRTTLALAPEAGTPQPAPSIVVASTFHYGDQSRRAVYTAAPPDPQVHMNGDQGDLTADRLELVLVAGRNALERLQATGRVVAVVGARTARGNELQYQVADERYVIVGAPVRFVDDCNESAGKTLTFFRASDRVIIDGNEEVRTQTRGGTCKK